VVAAFFFLFFFFSWLVLLLGFLGLRSMRDRPRQNVCIRLYVSPLVPRWIFCGSHPHGLTRVESNAWSKVVFLGSKKFSPMFFRVAPLTPDRLPRKKHHPTSGDLFFVAYVFVCTLPRISFSLPCREKSQSNFIFYFLRLV
jgi:hypothetical protein